MRVQVDRAERIDINAPGTIVVRARLPATVQIVNLSRTGCLFRSNDVPDMGAKLRIGIPGIGTRSAIVVRSGTDGIGCAFLEKLRTRDVDRARSARSPDRTEASAAIKALRRDIAERDAAQVPPPSPTWMKRLGRLRAGQQERG
ncbi:PilZ domain-containing protein [Sphingomonas sp.]|uniref:PilZ domain-containing protein n=1 Tax=Sphingomonas sp. TaxID=28214 RepID=UPI003B0083C9